MADSSNYDPRKPDPEFGPHERYGFAAGSEPPPVPAPTEAVEPEPDPEQPRKKRKKRPSAEGVGEVKPEHKDRILDREDTPDPVPWWAVPAALFVIGALFLMGPMIYLAISEKNAAITFYAMIGFGIGIAIEVVALTVLMVLVGGAFGIDYGSPIQAIVKLAALVTIVNGQTLLVAILCFPFAYFIAILLAGILAGATAYGLFMFLFRLSVSEALITVFGIVVASWLLNFAGMAILGAGR